MRSALALVRAAWLTAVSYRLATLISFAGVIASVVPIFLVSGAVQSIAEESIRPQGGDYFGFVIVGVACIYIIASAASAIPGAIAGSIGSGTLEAMLVTRTPLPTLLIGLSGYPLVQSGLRASVLVLGAVVLGVRLDATMLPIVAIILLLLVIAYGAIGLLAASLVVVFRTSGPLITLVITLSGLLGGAYYSTSVVPGWLRVLTDFVPLTYGLRATRMLLLGDATLGDVIPDVSLLTIIALSLLLVGSGCFALAMRRARVAGTLSQY